MKKAFLALLLAASISFGLETVIEPKERMTKNLFFVLDKSCSMSTDDLNKGVDAIIGIATQATDELNVAVIAFSDGFERWEGLPKTEPDGGPPSGWAAFPSKDAGDKLREWLGGVKAKGGTELLHAVHGAMNCPPPRKGGMTVVIVSDDKVSDVQLEQAPEFLKNAQEERVKKGYGQAVIVGYIIGSGESCLKRLVEVGPNGGLFREK